MTNKNARQRYICEAKHLLPVYQKPERKFIHDLNNSIDDLFSVENEQTYESITQKFGTPEEVVNDYIEVIGPDMLKRRGRRSRFRLVAAISVVVLVIAGLGIYTYHQNRLYELFDDTQISEVTYVIEQNPKYPDYSIDESEQPDTIIIEEEN